MTYWSLRALSVVLSSSRLRSLADQSAMLGCDRVLMQTPDPWRGHAVQWRCGCTVTLCEGVESSSCVSTVIKLKLKVFRTFYPAPKLRKGLSVALSQNLRTRMLFCPAKTVTQYSSDGWVIVKKESGFRSWGETSSGYGIFFYYFKHRRANSLWFSHNGDLPDL